MKYFFLFISLSITLFSCQSATEIKSTPQQKVETQQKTPISLPHLVRQPTTKTDRPPLIIILHGFGANERDLHEPLAPYFDPRFLVVSLRSPIELRPDSYCWYPIEFVENGLDIKPVEEEKARKKLSAVIDEVVDFYNADKNKVFLLGFSQGAIMSSTIVMTAPEKIRGAVLLSGQVPLATDKNMATAAAIGKVDLFISHGKKDKVLPIQDGRDLKTKLEKVGATNVIYKEHEGAHQLDGAHLREALGWLSERI